jgi:hypothetical protein
MPHVSIAILDLADVREQAERWCRDVAGTRVHGTTRKLPLVVFQDQERAHLLPFDGVPYDVPVWGQVERLLKAAEVFAQSNPYPEQMLQSWSVWWHTVPAADEIFRTAMDDIVRSNPDQISSSDTASTLTYFTHPASLTPRTLP